MREKSINDFKWVVLIYYIRYIDKQSPFILLSSLVSKHGSWKRSAIFVFVKLFDWHFAIHVPSKLQELMSFYTRAHGLMLQMDLLSVPLNPFDKSKRSMSLAR